MNKVFLIGRLTRDPELRYTGANIPVATFSIAINRNYTGQNGEREVDYINIVVWRKLAENVKNYMRKGSQVAIDGSIRTRSYEDQNGQRRYVTEVVADNVQFLDTKSSQSQNVPSGEVTDSPYNYTSDLNNNYGSSNNYNNYNNNYNPEPTYNTQTNNNVSVENEPFKDFGEEIKIEDDDLPF